VVKAVPKNPQSAASGISAVGSSSASDTSKVAKAASMEAKNTSTVASVDPIPKATVVPATVVRVSVNSGTSTTSELAQATQAKKLNCRERVEQIFAERKADFLDIFSGLPSESYEKAHVFFELLMTDKTMNDPEVAAKSIDDFFSYIATCCEDNWTKVMQRFLKYYSLIKKPFDKNEKLKDLITPASIAWVTDIIAYFFIAVESSVKDCELMSILFQIFGFFLDSKDAMGRVSIMFARGIMAVTALFSGIPSDQKEFLVSLDTIFTPPDLINKADGDEDDSSVASMEDIEYEDE
jgi:multisubunit Na+/H+ antiporter MnhC subunit